MTWITLFYAGAVVMTMGGEGISMDECRDIADVMRLDIQASYLNNPEEMAKTQFPTNQFVVDCLTEQLPVDKKYAE